MGVSEGQSLLELHLGRRHLEMPCVRRDWGQGEGVLAVLCFCAGAFERSGQRPVPASPPESVQNCFLLFMLLFHSSSVQSLSCV